MISVKRKGITLKVDVDYSYNPNPRDDEHLGTMACYHSRYSLGDEDVPKTYDDFKEWYNENKENVCCMLPLYLLDHSGLAMSTRDFNDRWDSGQVGWIYCTKEQAESAGYDVNDREKITNQLLKEVEDYHEYLVGVPYCYFCLTDENDENIETMTGFREQKLDDMLDEMKEYVDKKYHFVFSALLKKQSEAAL